MSSPSSASPDIWDIIAEACDSGDRGDEFKAEARMEQPSSSSSSSSSSSRALNFPVDDSESDSDDSEYLVEQQEDANSDQPGESRPNSPDRESTSLRQSQLDEYKQAESNSRSKKRPRGNTRMIQQMLNQYNMDEYDDGENPNNHNNKIQRNRGRQERSNNLDEVEEAMEMGLGDEVEEDEYESVPIIECDFSHAIRREMQYERTMLLENKKSDAGKFPEPYDPKFQFPSFIDETKSQEATFPVVKMMFTFASKAEETSDIVSWCMQIQDFYNVHIRTVSSIGNKCWPVLMIWEYFHIVCPSIKHNLEYELRCMNKLFDTISNCVLKKNKRTNKVDQLDIKCLNLQFKVMEHRNKLIREVYNIRYNQSSSETNTNPPA